MWQILRMLEGFSIILPWYALLQPNLLPMESWPHICSMVILLAYIAPLNRRYLLYHNNYSMQALFIGAHMHSQVIHQKKKFIIHYSVIMSATPHYLLTTFITGHIQIICPLYKQLQLHPYVHPY